MNMVNTTERAAPSVIIGVGGIGCDICASIARRMPADEPESSHVRFAIIDTDVNTIKNYQRMGFTGTSIVLSDNMTVGTCREMMKTYIRDWYPVNEIFDRKSMTEGAGQQRAISRLALEYAALEGKLSPLYQVINSLDETNPEEKIRQPITFYIISSLAGGTGSGIVLPLAMYLNDYIGGMHYQKLSNCKGFFLLSSALEGNVDSPLEQRSLDANAYAALKELSGFMRVEDGDDKRYGQLNMQLPGRVRARSGSTRPASYEYCFLFGMRNKDGVKVHTFTDLKDIVANAVYMQACSPMHGRNSSREDNKLRHNMMLMTQEGENYLRRFGAIGCGELCYPREQLKEYYAMCWAREVMQDQWQKYDLIYQKKEMEEIDKKKRGLKWGSVDRGAEYVRAILAADDQDVLAAEIRTACRVAAGDSWECYLDAMRAEIVRRIEAERDSNTSNASTDERELYENLCYCTQIENDRNELRKVTKRVVELYRSVEAAVRSLSEQYRGSLDESWYTLHPLSDHMPDYHMEYWLVKDGQFVHPNAVRYFLYQLRQAIDARRQKSRDLRDLAASKFANMADVSASEKKISSRFTSEKKLKRICMQRKEALDAVYEYVAEDIFEQMLERCGAYTDRLTAEYEKFYGTYQSLLQEFDVRIENLEEELNRKRGLNRDYVYADGACREKTVEEMRRQRAFSQVDGSLSYYIFQLMFNGGWERLREGERFESVHHYWCEGLEREFPQILSPHILHAIDAEEFCKYGRHMDAPGIKARIVQAKETMTVPFLQFRRLGSDNQGISIYCYNSVLKQQQGVFRDVVKWLQDEESVDDEHYCSPYRIVFYYSFFGLDVAELLEYMHGQEDTVYAMGPAFYSYEGMIEDMGKGEAEDAKVTPHTNRVWHNLRYLPDLQKDYQTNKEIHIGEALLYAYLTGRLYKNGGKYDLKLDYVLTLGNRLADCHNFLYDRQYLTEVLLWDMRREAERMLNENKEPLNLWLAKRGLWDMLFEYSGELNVREKNGLWKDFLLKSCIDFVINALADAEPWDRTSERLKKEYERLEKTVLENDPEDRWSRQLLQDVKASLTPFERT